MLLFLEIVGGIIVGGTFMWWSISSSLEKMFESERAALISDLKELSSEVTDSVLERLEMERCEALEAEYNAKQLVVALAHPEKL